ncbi:hypothetical protein J2Z22_003595 [Paenibacillus forsythiae]|uniref:Flagellar protein FliT n=1 Tax=Paenibacillus forsythiae TaxID=365616 RepID=A0ABU3HB22_9BACL|nr:hypothetical protein [Paenibacillus forsythiae]MDT3428005.1 hypothetical protein [Paenibacillus forsythiae]
MEDLLHKLNKLTLKSVNRLPRSSYEELESFVEQRQAICEEISQEYNKIGKLNAEQKALLTSILAYDEVILNRMHRLKTEASDWLERKQHIRTQQNAYHSVQAGESYFIDWKK